MKASAILAVASLAATASAAAIAYNEPISATTWTLGGDDTFTVSWRSGCEDDDSNVYDINLNVQSNGLQVSAGISPIGQLDCSDKEGSTTVTIPETVPSGSQYSILVVNGGVQSYSALFTIVNPALPASNSTSSTTAAATTTVASTTTVAATTTANSTTTATKTGNITTVSQTATNKPASAASSLKVGSTAALLIVAAVGLML